MNEWTVEFFLRYLSVQVSNKYQPIRLGFFEKEPELFLCLFSNLYHLLPLSVSKSVTFSYQLVSWSMVSRFFIGFMEITMYRFTGCQGPQNSSLLFEF